MPEDSRDSGQEEGIFAKWVQRSIELAAQDREQLAERRANRKPWWHGRYFDPEGLDREPFWCSNSWCRKMDWRDPEKRYLGSRCRNCRNRYSRQHYFRRRNRRLKMGIHAHLRKLENPEVEDAKVAAVCCSLYKLVGSSVDGLIREFERMWNKIDGDGEVNDSVRLRLMTVLIRLQEYLQSDRIIEDRKVVPVEEPEGYFKPERKSLLRRYPEDEGFEDRYPPPPEDEVE